MPFLADVASLPATIVHHTGSMVRFTSGQLRELPRADCDVRVDLPDGTVVQGHFRCHPANPYIAGREVVRWIKEWVPMGQTHSVEVRQVGQAHRVRVALIMPTPVVNQADLAIQRPARRLAVTLRSSSPARRRTLLETWERDPLLRSFVIDRWGSDCQVQGCVIQDEVPSHLSHTVVDVHHLTHLSGGGSDSPMNLSILCTTHHALVHRSKSKLVAADSQSARIQVNGIQLLLHRDVALLMA